MIHINDNTIIVVKCKRFYLCVFLGVGDKKKLIFSKSLPVHIYCSRAKTGHFWDKNSKFKLFINIANFAGYFVKIK